jgi:hypothetical protein
MKYVVETGPGGMIYIPKFKVACLRHSEFNRGRFSDTQTAWRSHKSTLGN